MPDLLYITADAIGTETGGGQVTRHESEALVEMSMATYGMGGVEVWSFPDAPRPWGSDEQAAARIRLDPSIRPRLCHIYAGCFTETVRLLKERGCKVVYTVAAHDRHVSREEHEKLGLPFPYPHLVEPELFARYSGGYREADIVVAPGEAPRRVLERDGVEAERIRIIPHGHAPPAEIKPLPKRFAVAALSVPGVDKGLRYLLEAWRMLNYSDAMLTIAGRGTEGLVPWVRAFGGGNVYLRGEVKSPSLVYNSCSLFVNSSATEGFGMPVIEAAAHGRYVLCSDGAGAADFVHPVKARDAADLARAIDYVRRAQDAAPSREAFGISEAVRGLAWGRIRERYKALWRSVLS